jgi:hypothetical protein
MEENDTQTSEVLQTQADDFKLINGIKSGIENRLYKAGITTYAQLIALSPDDIVVAVGPLVGMTAERVIKQDWIGQARQLQSQREQALAEMHSDQSRAERQHYATFTLELLLGGENEVRRTRIMHIQGKAEETWAGWEQVRVINFIISRAELRLTKPEPVLAGPGLIETTLPESQQPVLAGNPRLEELVVIPNAEDSPRRLISASQPFGVHMTLDLSEVSTPKDTPLEYSTTIFSKKLGHGERMIVGKAKGSCMPEEKVIIGIEEASLQEGVYRLEAEVFVKLLSEKEIHNSGLTAQLEGGLLRIY